MNRMLHPFAGRSKLDVRRTTRWVVAFGAIVVSAACSGSPNFVDASTDSDSDSDSDSDGPLGGSTSTGGNSLDLSDGAGGTTTTGGTSGNDPVCGNGDLEIGEVCDDGGEVDEDGCSADCLEADPDFLCLTPGEPCERVVTCGNGVMEGDEVCDDGDEDGGDGCSDDCSEVEEGFSCPKPGEDCVVDPICGNGTRERGEGCDDGQDPPGDDDGCDAQCQQEPGYFCPPGQACVEIVCGDGNRTPDEACDDDDNDDGDGCSATCTVEAGWYCSTSGCKAICGDGDILGTEECDDGDKASGDGCSGACRFEPFFMCDAEEPTVCISDIVCGDGDRDPGEVCDPAVPGEEECFDEIENPALACQAFETSLPSPVCGNSVIEFQEQCDGDGGSGGCIACVLQAGFSCPKPNYCVRIPVCGDGFIQSGEQCDVGINGGDGCVDCDVDPDYFCSGEPSVCVQSICGDGFRAPDEGCDNGPGTVLDPEPPVDGDGCSIDCSVEAGWVCPPGAACRPICGDGEVSGTEQCDTPDAAACTNCQLNAGYDCGDAGTGPCVVTQCGTNGDPLDPVGAAEAGEGCDDDNLVAGDGCGPTCQLEPEVNPPADATADSFPTVVTTCGDGLMTGSEECDDGNLTDGDGCSGTKDGPTDVDPCVEETGWDCNQNTQDLAYVDFKITYRDFIQRRRVGGHPHMKETDQALPQSASDLNIAGVACTTANTANCGRLDTFGKPQYNESDTNNAVDNNGAGDPFTPAQHTEFFKLWYRDTNDSSLVGANGIIQMSPNPATVPTGGDVLRLSQLGGSGSSVYRFASDIGVDTNNFYPLGSTEHSVAARGFGFTRDPGADTIADYQAGSGVINRNFHFTSELRYFFQYQGGESLVFYGDDDVFVFINGRLAVDVGGIHGTLYGRVVLGDDGEVGGASSGTDSNCSLHNSGSETALGTCLTAEEEGDDSDERFNLDVGDVYEIVVFQAERHPTGSNYQLTLDGFMAPRSFCTTTCGDDDVGGPELCDDGPGMPSSGYGVCLSDCTFEFCGDGDPQLSDEECDDGTNGVTYGTGFQTDCAPGCQWAPYCGDGLRQSAEEDCDDGTNDGSFGTCNPDCTLAPYCGDREVEVGEEDCDPLDGVFGNYGDGVCGYDCEWAPNCGDGVRNGPELCDDGPDNGTPASDCNDICEFDPFCGDGLKTSNEECDYGSFGYSGPPEEAPFGGCTTACELGPYCGDETVHDEYGEECDEGDLNSDVEYEGCTESCLLGPHCGDTIVQTAADEACDNGFNEDVYRYPGSTGACGVGCNDVPYCGDGAIQASYELCDDGPDNADDAYDGCTTTCDWGPYCGDDLVNGDEDCDDGPDNVAYSPDGEGCSYECDTDIPYCGDGMRNGPEQCDEGEDNDGEYGGCNEDCTRAPYCGDHIVQSGSGEQCDDGPTGSLACSTMCVKRDMVK